MGTVTQQNHPEAIKAQQRADQKKLDREKMKAQIQLAQAEQKVHFHHDGIYTFCYRKDKHNVIEFSNTIRHPKDKPDQLFGKYEALKRFGAANRVLARIPNYYTPREFLSIAFAEVA